MNEKVKFTTGGCSPIKRRVKMTLEKLYLFIYLFIIKKIKLYFSTIRIYDKC